MNDRPNEAWNMVLGVGGCLVLLGYGAVCFFASVALLHEYWEFNLFVAILIAVLALRFAPALMAIGTVLGAWLVWEWPLVAAIALGAPGLVFAVAVLFAGGALAMFMGLRDRVLRKPG